MRHCSCGCSLSETKINDARTGELRHVAVECYNCGYIATHEPTPSEQMRTEEGIFTDAYDRFFRKYGRTQARGK